MDQPIKDTERSVKDAQIARDARDGSMASINGPMPAKQAWTYDKAPANWTAIPPVGIHEMMLNSLRDRGLIETRWENGNIRQWRRTP